MPSFDIVNQINLQDVDDAVNVTHKQIATRYDLRGTSAGIVFDRKAKDLTLTAPDTMKLEAVRQMFMTNAAKRGIDLKSFRAEESESAAGGAVRRKLAIREGIEKETAKKIVKLIKDTKLKVQPAIQGEEVRVTGKQIDDLQSIIQMLKAQDLDAPLQFVNMRS
ncbi:MAG TPA: YajQ family cyclic di-GMP-binding protein [Rhodothermales bacterium]|nr:YajQ family cyclic di-GMP-binding protein [Rhodothermales bacterium]